MCCLFSCVTHGRLWVFLRPEPCFISCETCSNFKIYTKVSQLAKLVEEEEEEEEEEVGMVEMAGVEAAFCEAMCTTCRKPGCNNQNGNTGAEPGGCAASVAISNSNILMHPARDTGSRAGFTCGTGFTNIKRVHPSTGEWDTKGH